MKVNKLGCVFKILYCTINESIVTYVNAVKGKQHFKNCGGCYNLVRQESVKVASRANNKRNSRDKGGN